MTTGPTTDSAAPPASDGGRPATSGAVASLASAVPRRVHVVVEVRGGDALARRLASVGMWPGARVELLARAPFGDPLLFRVHGYRLALRRSEAERVMVRDEAGS